jgi:hypothetical protein
MCFIGLLLATIMIYVDGNPDGQDGAGFAF